MSEVVQPPLPLEQEPRKSRKLGKPAKSIIESIKDLGVNRVPKEPPDPELEAVRKQHSLKRKELTRRHELLRLKTQWGIVAVFAAMLILAVLAYILPQS